MHITALYGGLLGLLLALLSARVMLWRFMTGVVVGDEGDAEKTAMIRAHGNFIEYVPLTILLIGLAEYLAIGSKSFLSIKTGQTWPPLLIHGLGITLVLGRVLHAAGMWKNPGISMGRRVGTAMTMIALCGAAILTTYLGFTL